MPITKHIVRLPQAQLARLLMDPRAVNELVSFTVPSRDDHIDIGWSAHGLVKLAAHLPPNVRNALALVIQGEGTVADEGAFEDLYSDIKYVDAADVKRAVEELSDADVQGFVGTVPDDPLLRTVLGAHELPDGARAYYIEQMFAVLAFVRGAAARGLGLVVWWQ